MPTGALIILIALAIFLILYLLIRPEGLQRRTGKVLGFVGFLVLPILTVALGAGSHLEHSKTTQFCLSCHEMQPYGQTLFIDDAEYLPAHHYQNKRMPRDLACFSCHTDYTMYGDIHAKIRGLRHLWVHYAGTIPESIELYTPFQNRECLYCHGGARSFDENDFHIGMEEDLDSGEVSCLDCHSLVHPVEEVAEMPRWQPVEEGNPEVGGKP